MAPEADPQRLAGLAEQGSARTTATNAGLLFNFLLLAALLDVILLEVMQSIAGDRAKYNVDDASFKSFSRTREEILAHHAGQLKYSSTRAGTLE